MPYMPSIPPLPRKIDRRKVLAVGVTLAAVVLACSVLYGYIYLQGHPWQPAAGGDFPSQPVWVSVDMKQRVVSTPVVSGDQILIRTEDALCSMDARHQLILWCAASKAGYPPELAPMVSGEWVVAVEGDSKVAVFSRTSGKLNWRSNILSGGRFASRSASIAAVAVNRDTVYVSRRAEYELTAYSLEDGDILWSVIPPDRSTLHLALDGQALYLASGDSVTAYDLKRGRKLWSRDFDWQVSTILVDQNTLVVAHYGIERLLTAINLADQQERWQVPSSQTGIYHPEFLVASGGQIYVSGKGLAVIEQTSGKVLWSKPVDEHWEPAVVLNGHVYVRSIGTMLYALDLQTGQETGHLLVQVNSSSKNDPPRGPAVFEDLLLVPFGDHRIFAYRP